MPLFATPPAWWSDPQTQILDTSNPATLEDNYAPANLGQLKNVAKQAKAHLDAHLPGGAEVEINTAVANFEPKAGATYTPSELGALRATNYAPVNLGQLKAVAKPFYDQLLSVSYDTKANLIAHGYPSNWAYVYPWSPPPPKAGETGCDPAVYSAWIGENYAPANLGQLKAVFSFDLANFLPPSWQQQYFGQPTGIEPAADPDRDGLSNLQEYQLGSNPHLLDSDTDDLPDGFEAAIGSDPADSDTNDNGMPDGEELARGGNPALPGSPPPSLPPPSTTPPPPPEPAPTPPAFTAPADYDVLLRTRTVSMPKYGFAPFLQTNPAQRYLVKFDQDYHTPTAATPDFPYQSVTLTTTVDAMTGATTPVSSVPGSVPDLQCTWPQSETREMLKLAVAGTSTDQNGFRDSGYFVYLQTENATGDMVAHGLTKLGAFEGEYEVGTPFAYRNVHENELQFDYQRVEFKFAWHEDVQPENRHPVTYLVVFKPENDPATEENESETQREIVQTVHWDGENQQQTFTLDPEVLKPEGKDGEYSLLPVDIKFIKPEATTWADTDELPEAQVIRFEDKTRIRIKIPIKLDNLADVLAIAEFQKLNIKTLGTKPDGVDVALSAANCTFVANANDCELHVEQTREQLMSLRALPQAEQDNVKEIAWFDLVKDDRSNLSDSQAWEGANHGIPEEDKRGRCYKEGKIQENGDRPLDKTFAMVGGAQLITAEFVGAVSEKRQLADQSDVFYISGHGSYGDGTLRASEDGIQRLGAADARWDKDMEVVIVGGCSIFGIQTKKFRYPSMNGGDKDFYDRHYRHTADPSPGEAWEGIKPVVKLGYAFTAPLDTQGMPAIIASYQALVNGGMDTVAAWGQANKGTKGVNACAIDTRVNPHEYWYFKKVSTGWFSSDLQWTKTTKTPTGW